MVAVETSIDLGNNLWFFYECLNGLIFRANNIHIVRELRHILFGRMPALVVPVYIAMEPCSMPYILSLHNMLEFCLYMLLSDDEVHTLYDK